MRERTSYVQRKPPKPTCSKCEQPLEDERLGKYRYCRQCATAMMRATRERQRRELVELRLRSTDARETNFVSPDENAA